MTRRLGSESGQAILLTVTFLVVLLGAAAMAIDVGAWYHEQRRAQATADAAALAGAQDLPAVDTTQAAALAAQYATDNGGGVGAGDIGFRNDYATNDSIDTIVVKVHRQAPTFFAKIFAIDSVNVGATAAARAGTPDQVSGVAPIVVDKLHPLLSGHNCPCFHVETTIGLGKTDPWAPGAFGLIRLDPNASNGVPTLASWIQDGYNGFLPLGQYYSDPGAKFNAGPVVSALDSRVGTDLLFPVWDGAAPTGGGSGALYNIIGWVAFHLDCVGTITNGQCVNGHGNSDNLTGYFTRAIWNGIQSQTNKHLPDFGVYTVSLVN